MRDGEKMTHCMPVCISKGISKREAPPHKKKKHMDIVCVCRCALCVVIVARSDLFFPITPTAYVWFIYIHGYPDNEAFNPGDPAVRTMNPITSCRL